MFVENVAEFSSLCYWNAPFVPVDNDVIESILASYRSLVSVTSDTVENTDDTGEVQGGGGESEAGGGELGSSHRDLEPSVEERTGQGVSPERDVEEVARGEIEIAEEVRKENAEREKLKVNLLKFLAFLQFPSTNREELVNMFLTSGQLM